MAMNGKRWALWGAGMGVAASIAAAAHIWELPAGANAAPAEATAEPAAIPVTVATVEARKITTWQAFSGRLEAVDRVEVRGKVAGSIQAVHFREGGLVKAGDLLVTIDPEPYQAIVAQAEGAVASATARVDLARTELDRGKLLSAKATISQSDLAQRQSAYSEAIATLQSAKAALRAAEINLDYSQIRAPISGRAGRLEITAGNLIAAGSGSPLLTTLVSVDRIYASFDVGEELITRTLASLPADGTSVLPLETVPVEIGTAADEGTPIHGNLQLIDNEVNATSGTIRVRAVFDNPGGHLIPGQFVRVRMGEPEAEQRLMVSERAVGTDQDKKFVFVVDAKNTIVYRQVELGTSVDGQRIVEKGLTAGDQIVVNGLQRIRPGAGVDPPAEAKVAQQ